MADGGGLPGLVLRLSLLLLLLGMLEPLLIPTTVFITVLCNFLFNCGVVESWLLMEQVLVYVVVAKVLLLCSCKPGCHEKLSRRMSLRREAYKRWREARGVWSARISLRERLLVKGFLIEYNAKDNSCAVAVQLMICRVMCLVHCLWQLIIHDNFIDSPLKNSSIRNMKASNQKLLRDRPCLFSGKETVSFVTMFVLREAKPVETKKATTIQKMEKNWTSCTQSYALSWSLFRCVHI